MDINTIAHKGLQRFICKNDPSGIRSDQVTRIRRILSVLISAEDIEEVEGPPGWRVHKLSGDRDGLWSVRVSGNCRITFRVIDNQISDLNLEGYH
ncbi:MAG: type II toxin-antitoxin system RelE/ParE family toxin [Pseudomonadota bacterium]